MRLHCNLVDSFQATAARTYQEFQCDYLERKSVCDLIRLKCKSLYKWLTILRHSTFKSLSSSSSSSLSIPYSTLSHFKSIRFFFPQSVVRNSLSMQFFRDGPTRRDPTDDMELYKDVVKFAFDKCSLSPLSPSFVFKCLASPCV